MMHAGKAFPTTRRQCRQSSLPSVTTSLLLLFLAAASSDNNSIAAASSNSSSVAAFKFAPKSSAAVPHTYSPLPTIAIAMAVDTSPYSNHGNAAIDERQADNPIIRSEEDEKVQEVVASEEDFLPTETDPYVTEPAAAAAAVNNENDNHDGTSNNKNSANDRGDSIAINNDGTVKDAVDALKELGVVLTEQNYSNRSNQNETEANTYTRNHGVVNPKDQVMPRIIIQPADSEHDDHQQQQQQQSQQQQQQQGVKALSRREKMEQELREARRGPQKMNRISTSEEEELPIRMIERVKEEEEEVESQQQEQEREQQRDVVQSGLRGGDNPMGVITPQQQQNEDMTPPIQEKPRSPEQQLPSPEQQLSEEKRRPIPLHHQAVLDKASQQQQQQQQQEQDVDQSGLRGGDIHNQKGDVTPQQQQQNGDVTPPIQEKPRIPEQQLPEEKQRPMPLHHQAVLDKAREVTNEQSSSVEEIISDLAVSSKVESKSLPLPKQEQQEQSQQQELMQQQQVQKQKPMSNPSSSVQNLENLPDAVKNTMIEMEKKDLEEGKEIGYHYKELREQKKREADLRRQKLTVGRGGYGGGGGSFVRPPPQAFRIDDPDAAQKFADYIAKQKKGIVRKEKIRHPIQAIVGDGDGSSNNHGSVRTKDSSPILKNYKAQINHKKSNQKMPDLRPEAQPKKRVGQTILKKIPVVKRAIKRTHGFETLNDAALSFTRGLLMGVFRNNNHALDKKRKAALLDWLDLLSISLPPELGLHELIDTLKINMDIIAQSPSNLKAIIDKHPIPDSQYSNSCTKGVDHQGFFCGFWKLLHVASVGFAEQQGGLMLRELHPNIRVFSPKEAGSVLREYMGMFFNCDKCSNRFIAQYDECKFQSCNRLTDRTVDAPDESWAEFPLWLWEVHNDVSRSKAERAADFHEKQNRKAEAKKWERYMGAVYPHLDQCLSCWTAEGTWDLGAVYNHLEKEYWTFGVVVDSRMETLLDHREASFDSVSYGLGAYLGLGVAILLTYVIKKYKIRASGRHKKEDENLFPSRSGDGKIKYRDS